MKLNYICNFFFRVLKSIAIKRIFFMVAFICVCSSAYTQVTVTATDPKAEEGTPVTDFGTFTIDLGVVPISPVTVNYTFSGAATEGVDYNLTSGSVIINNSQTAELTIVPTDDLLVEGNETVIITLTSTDSLFFPVAISPDNTATVEIGDNDVTPETVFLMSATPPYDGTASEAGTDIGRFQVRLSRSPNQVGLGAILEVYVSLTGTATLTDDYTATNFNGGVITFSGNQRARNITITNIVDDTLIEGDEDAVLTITGTNSPLYVVNPTLPSSQSVIILDNDTCPTITTAPVLEATVPTVFCDVINQDLNAYTTSIAPVGSVLTWGTSSDLLDTNSHLANTVINGPGKYYGFFYNATDNCAGPPLCIELQIFNTPTLDVPNLPVPTCGASSFTLEATVSAGGTLNWYDSEVGGVLLATGTMLVTPVINTTTTYYVDASANGCVSDRIPVEATINNQPTPGTTMAASACSTSGNGRITIIDLDSTITGQDTGEWSVTTDPSGSVIIDANNVVDFEGLTSGNYVFTYTTTGALAPCTNESVTVNVVVTTCTVDTDGDGINDDDETILGTNPTIPDTDGDGINDGVEVGSDVANPLDTDLDENGVIVGDGIIDALDSNILDADGDMVVDQLDPENSNPCVPSNTATVCDTDGDGITDGDEIAAGTDHLDPCDPNLTPACMPDDIDLSVEKTVDKSVINVNGNVTFTITLTNLTQDRIIDVEVADLLAYPFEYVSDVASIGTYDELTGLWTIDEILADETHTLEITVNIEQLADGDYENLVTILSSFPNDSDTTNDESSVTVSVNGRSNNECGFLFNQFSPNMDGINDFLRINCIENYPDNTLDVYDRYGNAVFEAKNYDNTWDGTGKNGNLPKGTYYYILNLGDGSDVTKGWIQIIR